MSDEETALAELNAELAKTPISLPVVGTIEMFSPEWQANVLACRGPHPAVPCKYWVNRNGQYCGYDGKAVTVHAQQGTCPLHRQPHVRAGHVALDEVAIVAQAKAQRAAAMAAMAVKGPPRDIPAYPVDFRVDLVYLWVDGCDPAWRASYAEHVGKQPPDGSRFADADELRFSLRSVELYAPWVNRIFIVTAGQVPAWLNTENPKVQIVDHSEIIPPEHLPTFNSQTIERFIGQIPGLSEHFLYANDDMLLTAPLQPGNFFTSEGVALMHFGGAIGANEPGIYGHMKSNAAELLTGWFGSGNWRRGWHQIKPYRKAMVEEIAQRNEDVAVSMVRSRDDVAWNCVLWPNYAIAAGFGIDVPADRRLSCGYADVGNNASNSAKAFGHHVGCVNNVSPATAAGVRESLEDRFVQTSQFEKRPAYDVTLITPTGDRKECFALLEKWVARQSFKGKVQWIVVDDGNTPTVCTMGQVHIRRQRLATDAPHTLPANVLAALPSVAGEDVVILEDDDWYSAGYIEDARRRLSQSRLTGIYGSLYVRHDPAMYKRVVISGGATFACTAFKASAVPFLRECCEHCIKTNSYSLDRLIWSRFTGKKLLDPLNRESPVMVQMKAMPGRMGQLASHKTTDKYSTDGAADLLRRWLGDDLHAYEVLLD